MKRLQVVVFVILTAAFVLTACGAPAPAATSAPAAVAPAAASDLLATVLSRGTLVVSTDPAYPPQSALKENPQRTAGTKCTADQKTLGELEGFDIDTSAAIAKGLGVEACFVTPDWTLITAGGWSGRWDISVGSMTITPERAKVLYFAQPYYTTPAALFVYKDNKTYSTATDLNGKKIGVCGGCTYEAFLNGSLVIPGEKIDFVIKDAVVKTYDTDSTALEDLALGDGARLDAVLTAQPTGQQAIDAGKPIRPMGSPVFFEYLAPAFDRQSALDPHSLIAKVTEIVLGLHKDGTLSKLSSQWYKLDLAQAAATFDAAEFGK